MKGKKQEVSEEGFNKELTYPGIKYLNFMVRKSKAHSIRSSWSFIKNRNASS